MNNKIIGCSIHGNIIIDPIAIKIIDTPEFQRMRYIKQLSLCRYVYPSATHTRFEHSIGVYHLANIIITKIIDDYPDIECSIPELGVNKFKISDKIVDCIRIAGLCHDIGHGPYSHCFDNILLEKSNSPNKEHEVRSCIIIKKIIKRELSDYFDDNHISLIQAIINPSKMHSGFIYQIISNLINDIDVDKFDYLARDSANLGINISFDFKRLLYNFIIDENNNIAYPQQCYFDIYEMYYSRYTLHKKVYNHKTIKLIESMINDIFMLIDPIFKISETIDDIDLFCKLTDNTIFNYINNIIYPHPYITISLNVEQYSKIIEANKIYERILSRNLYKRIIHLISDENREEHLNEFIMYVVNKNPEIQSNNFIIRQSNVKFFSGTNTNPFYNIYFYNKKQHNKTYIIDNIHKCIPSMISEKHWILIYKSELFIDEVYGYVIEYFG